METQKTVSDWATKTFGYPKSPEVAIQRMLKECKELEEKLEMKICNNSQYEKYADEIADIFITGYQAMTTLGFSVQGCIDHKMEINRHRKWILDGVGGGQHVEENK